MKLPSSISPIYLFIYTCSVCFANIALELICKIKPVSLSHKIREDLKVTECKPRIVNQQCIVYKFKCNLYDVGHIGYMRGHLHERVEGHKRKSIYRHFESKHKGRILEKLLEHFQVLAKCLGKFDCLTKEMLFIRQQKPELKVQSDSVSAKVFIKPVFTHFIYIFLSRFSF